MFLGFYKHAESMPSPSVTELRICCHSRKGKNLRKLEKGGIR